MIHYQIAQCAKEDAISQQNAGTMRAEAASYA